MSNKIEKLKEINKILEEVLSKLETRIFIESVPNIRENKGNEMFARLK